MNKLKLPKFSIQLFAVTIIAGFLMSSVPKLISGPVNSFRINVYSKLVSPVPATNDSFAPLRERLENKENSFKIKKGNQFNLIPTSNAASEYENATAYIVVDYDTGEVLASKNEDKKTRIASITKVMSSVVALDLASPGELFSVTQDAVGITPTKMGVTAGHKYSVEELLQGSLLTSANDAVEILEDGIDEKYGKQKGTFIKAMNAKAQFLGLDKSTFDNPQGFDGPDHFSSAQDVAVLTHYALSNYPMIKETVKKDYAFLPQTQNHKQHDLYNWNGLIGTYPGTYGVKIGNTGEAMYTTSVISERNGKKIIVVLLGAPGVLERDLWASQLFDLGFSRLANLEPVELTSDILKEKYSSWEYW